LSAETDNLCDAAIQDVPNLDNVTKKNKEKSSSLSDQELQNKTETNCQEYKNSRKFLQTSPHQMEDDYLRF